MSAAQGSGLWALSSLASDSATARSEPQFLRPCPGRSCRRRRGGTEWGRRVTGALFSGSCNPESLPGLGRKGVQRLAEAETGSEPPGPRGEPGGVAGRAGCVFVPTPAVGGETGSRARSPPPAFPSAPGAERWGPLALPCVARTSAARALKPRAGRGVNEALRLTPNAERVSWTPQSPFDPAP